jgi:hypothetical protein
MLGYFLKPVDPYDYGRPIGRLARHLFRSLLNIAIVAVLAFTLVLVTRLGYFLADAVFYGLPELPC